MECKVLSYKGNVSGVEPPNFVELEIVKTGAWHQGDTATNTLKPATLETARRSECPCLSMRGKDPHRYPYRRIYGARLTDTS